MKKKIIQVVFIIILIFSMLNITNAQNSNNKQKITNYENSILLQEYKKMKDMSIEELQFKIDNIKCNLDKKINTRGTIINPIKLAWLYAAEIARKKGYPLSATIVEYSVLDLNYYEKDSDFAKAIKKTSEYKRIMELPKGSGDGVFNKSDLFYSIHKFNYHKNSSELVYITDVFDFENDYYIDNLLANIANNAGFLSQNLGALNPILIEIKISK